MPPRPGPGFHDRHFGPGPRWGWDHAWPGRWVDPGWGFRHDLWDLDLLDAAALGSLLNGPADAIDVLVPAMTAQGVQPAWCKLDTLPLPASPAQGLLPAWAEMGAVAMQQPLLGALEQVAASALQQPAQGMAGSWEEYWRPARAQGMAGSWEEYWRPARAQGVAGSGEEYLEPPGSRPAQGWRRAQGTDPSFFVYKVQAGDTLSELALRFFGDAAQWPVLMAGMPRAPLADCTEPEKLPVGAKIHVPCTYYVVQADDNLATIAQKTLGDAGRWRRILAANRAKIHDPNQLEVGWRLAVPRVPDDKPAVSPAAAPTPSASADDWGTFWARKNLAVLDQDGAQGMLFDLAVLNAAQRRRAAQGLEITSGVVPDSVQEAARWPVTTTDKITTDAENASLDLIRGILASGKAKPDTLLIGLPTLVPDPKDPRKSGVATVWVPLSSLKAG